MFIYVVWLRMRCLVGVADSRVSDGLIGLRIQKLWILLYALLAGWWVLAFGILVCGRIVGGFQGALGVWEWLPQGISIIEVRAATVYGSFRILG